MENTVATLVTPGGATLYCAPPEALGAIVFSPPAAAGLVLTPDVVSCGPMFSAGRPDYLVSDAATGARASSRYPTRGATVVVDGGAARVVDGAHDGRVAVQGFPQMVRAGVVLSRAEVDAESVARVALCVLRDGRVALAWFVGSMLAFARELATVARDVIYLDGGSAAYLRGPTRRDGGATRALPSVVTLSTRTAAPRASTGNGAALAIVAAVAALALKRR